MANTVNKPNQETDADKRYQEILALSRVSAALSGLWSLDAILNVALSTVLDIMNGSVGGILLLDEQANTLSYRVHRGLSARYVQEMRLELGEGIAGRVAESGKAVLLEDISKDSRVTQPDLVSSEGLKAFVSVPIRSKDKVLGVINIASRTAREFTKNDMYLLYSIGDQLGVAIEQTKLNERLRIDRVEIAKLEEERTHFLSFLGIAAHDLKAPLTAIQGFLWVILGGFAGPVSEKQKNMLERCSVRITELLNLISDLLDIPRIETGHIVPEMTDISLNQIIRESYEELINVAREKNLNLNLEIPDSVSSVYGSASRFKQVITNLISNAINYTSEGDITVRVKDGENEITVEVIDTGIGIPAQDLPRVFEEFFRARNVESKGTGLGLAITRRLIEAHGGRIWVESPYAETGKGSKFAFTVPKRSNNQ